MRVTCRYLRLHVCMCDRDAATLVQCAPESLEEAITVKKVDKMFGRVPLVGWQAAKNCDALSKTVYRSRFLEMPFLSLL